MAKVTALFGFLISMNSYPHGGAHASRSLGFNSWNFEWHIVLGLALMGGIYFLGWKKAIQRKRSLNKSAKARLLFFLGAMISLIASLISPIDAYSDMLGSVHMIQHTLLLMVAAPLLVLASPGFFTNFALPRTSNIQFRLFKKAYRWMLKAWGFKRPLLIWLLYALTLWVWHIPKLYEAALQSELVHDFQHLGFFLTSFLFWRVVFDPYRAQINPGLGILYLFVASIHAMILGVLMALSPVPWYAPYVETAPLFGLSALEDQQLAGYIMWMPAGASYLVVALALARRLIAPKKAVSS